MPPESVPPRPSDFNCPCSVLEFTQVRWTGSKCSCFIKLVSISVSDCAIRELVNSEYSLQLVVWHTATIFAQNSRCAPLRVHVCGHALWRANTESKLVDLFGGTVGESYLASLSQGCSYVFICVGQNIDTAMGAAQHFCSIWNRMDVNGEPTRECWNVRTPWNGLGKIKSWLFSDNVNNESGLLANRPNPF